MCCDDGLPPAVGEALARYRALLASRGLDWGGEAPDMMIGVLDLARRWGLSALLPALAFTDDATRQLDADAVVRALVAEPAVLPAGVVVIENGSVRFGPPLNVLVDAVPQTWLPGGVVVVVTDAAVTRLEIAPETPTVEVAGSVVDLTPAVRRVAGAVVELSAPWPVRWTVLDEDGQPWAPAGARLKYDVHDRPFFHAELTRVDVPAGLVRVTAARGQEFTSFQTEVRLAAGEVHAVAAEPQRWWDGDGGGWTGADLHVHANYSGDGVTSLHDAVLMQQGEGLDLMGLVAGNWHGDEIYDQALVESRLGKPYQHAHGTTAFGIEFRNDLLGHFHATGGDRAPTHWATGHERCAHPWDWPANAVTAQELRGSGAAIGYCHPVVRPFPSDGSPDHLFDWVVRSVEARELVVDAALGHVDSIDLLFSGDPSAPAELWYRLLGCGLRLAPTAGTDVFLSFSRAGAFSGPPGSGRVYAWTGGEHSPQTFTAALRRGHVIVSNGPWVRLLVDGQPEGSELDGPPGRLVSVTARAEGPGASRLDVLTAGGHVIASAEGDLAIDLVLPVEEATWIAARVTGEPHPDVLAERAWAHTGATWLHVDGRRVRRDEDLAWCNRWLDLLDEHVTTHGRFEDDSQRTDLLATFAAARPFYAAS